MPALATHDFRITWELDTPANTQVAESIAAVFSKYTIAGQERVAQVIALTDEAGVVHKFHLAFLDG